MEEIERIACFTGHRPHANGMSFVEDNKDTQELAQHVDEALQLLCNVQGVRVFLCGMASGFDLFAAQRLLYLQRMGKIDRAVHLIAVLPYQHRVLHWRAPYWKEAFRRVLLQSYDRHIVYVNYQPDCFEKRNAFMVEHAYYVLAYWNHNPRTGTGQTMRMARQNQRVLINLYDL